MERTKKPVLHNATINLKEYHADSEYNTDLPELSRFQVGDDTTHKRKNNTETLCFVSW